MKNERLKTRSVGFRLRGLVLLFPVLLLVSCGGKTIVDDEREFENNVWNRFTPEKFEAGISNTDAYYNIDLTVKIDTAVFRYSSLPLTVNIYSPNGEHRMFYAEVAFRENDRWKGEVQDGQRSVTTHIRTFFSFNSKGDHRIEIGQATSQYDLEGIHSIELDIYKVKLDYGDL